MLARSIHNLPNRVEHFIYRDGGDTSFAITLAPNKNAVAARNVMENDLVLVPVREPNTSLPTRTKNRDAGNSSRGGEVHRSAIMAEIK
jgi:hypothetical protein